MTSIYDNRAIGIDISHYQDKVDWSKCDADYVIIKAGEGKTPDAKCSEHVQGAYDAKKPIGLYWFHDPTIYALAGFSLDDDDRWFKPENDPQLQALIAQCKTKAFDFIVLDHERWWLYYNEYFEYLNKKRDIADVRKVTDAWNSKSAKVSAGRINDWLIANYPDPNNPAVSRKKLLIYSAKWFIDAYSPSTRAWIDQYDQWSAEYIQPGERKAIANIAEYREKYLPLIGTKSPKWLANKQWFIWQVSGDCFTVPWVLGGTGQPSAIDINISSLPKEQFYKVIGWTPNDTPPPPPPDDDDDPPPNTDPVDNTALVAAVDRNTAQLKRIADYLTR